MSASAEHPRRVGAVDIGGLSFPVVVDDCVSPGAAGFAYVSDLELEAERAYRRAYERYSEIVWPFIRAMHEAVLDRRAELLYGPCARCEGMGV